MKNNIFLLFLFIFNVNSFSKFKLYNRQKEFENDFKKNSSYSIPSLNKDLYYTDCILDYKTTLNSVDFRSGFDERFNKSEISIKLIENYFKKFNLLKILLNENISDHVKMELIDNYYSNSTIYVNNLFAGGLFDFFD